MRPGGFFGALRTGKRNESPAACVREVFALRHTVPRSKKGTCPKQMPPYMVRVTGLEPARQRHQNLNLARLPFRHTRMDRYLFSIPAPR